MNQALNLDDAELLKRFVHARDEASFEELVRRHGPAVLGACRRICPAPEAEDAAQAVFLTLAQKAHALRVHATLGPWLHRVAVCVSRDARRTAQARTKREQEAALAMQRADGNEALEELKPVLDEAIDALPEAYRAPLVLHHLEGLTHEAAAERLGLKSSTLSMRLTRGRELLRERLAQRGAIVSLSVLSAGLASLALGSPPSAAFAASTAKIAVLLASGQTIAAGTISAQASALTQGALKMLFLQKLQWTAAAGLAALLAITVTTSAVLKAADGERDATRSRPSPELRNAPPAAPLAAPEAKPAVLTGLIPQAGRARDLLGSAGCLVVRSAARWDALRAALAAAGWEQPAEHPLARVDFTKQRIVGVFKFGDSGNAFTCLGASGDDRRREVKFAMSYVIYKGKVQAAMAWKFCFAAVPLAETLNVSVGTYHPMNGGLYPTLEKAREEWSAAFDAARGDLIDGVSALVTPKAAKIAAGEDIQAEFKLVLHPHQAAPGDRFAADANEAWVWDGKYSNGYRNYGFLVETPDGKVLELRRPEQLEWAKNAPHPEPITGAKPYLLPDGQPGAISLKNLGLNTDVPGRYRITGLYAETAQDAKAWRGKEQDVRLWGGNLASNTFEVEVAAK